MIGDNQKIFNFQSLSLQEKKKFEEEKLLQSITEVKITQNSITDKQEGVMQVQFPNYDLPISSIGNQKIVQTSCLSKQVQLDVNVHDSVIKPINQVINGKQQQKISEKASSSQSQLNEQIKKICFLSDSPHEIYRFAKQLGKGSNCTVYQTFHQINVDECLAVRIIKVLQQQTLHKNKIDAAVMSMCANKNIVNYHCSYYFMDCLFMFIQLMDGGCLTQIINQNLHKIPEKISAYIMKEILQGLKVLHDHKIIHRNLKSEHILVAKDGTIKVANFGLSIQMTKEEQQKNRSIVGTPAWMAPQMISKKCYNELVDVWSIGVIAVELADGEPPFLRLPPLKTMFFISSKDAYRLNNAKFSQNYCDFVERCLQKDVNKRWSINQLLNHPFITEIGNGQKQKKQFSQMVKNIKEVSISQPMEQN